MATAILNSRPIIEEERLAWSARLAGVPRDTLERFVEAGNIPQQKQLQFHAAARSCDLPNGPTEIGIGGARGGAKSHAVVAQIALDDCVRAPGVKFLMLRQVGRYAQESFDDLYLKIIANSGIPHRRKRGELEFANGSRIVLGHFKDENDINNYLGIEYDGLAIEEATQLNEKKYLEIHTCRRTSKPNWRPRTYTTTNPGGIGHVWYKKRFIEPWRAGTETNTRFIFATYKDNAALNVDYEGMLNQLKGWQLAAWRDGDWDIASGQYFSNWRHDFQTCKPFKIPRHWPVWASLDYGFTHPTAGYLFTENDGIVYVVGEHVQAKTLVAEQARLIKAMFARHDVPLGRLFTFVAGRDVFANRGDAGAKTIATQYAEAGINLVAADDDRLSGASEMLNMLGDPEKDKEPTLKIFSTCTRLLSCLPAMQHDPHRPEDVLKVDVDENGDGGDDAYDAARYGIMARRRKMAIVVPAMMEQRSTWSHA
jgi:hypothetical protein